MREQIERLTKLTTDLLDLSKLDADAIEIAPRAVDLGELAREVAAEFGPAAERHGSRLERATPSEPAVAARRPGSGRADHPYPASTTRSPTRRREPRSTVDHRQPQNGAAELVVTDDGPGIDRARRATASSSASTPATRLSGSGLGLAIARELALRMDGALEVALAPRPHRLHARACRARGRRATEPTARALRGSRALAARSARALAGARRLRRRGARPAAASATDATTDRRATDGSDRARSSIQAADGGFDPEAIYDSAARPAWSRSSRSSATSGAAILGGGGGGRPGLGLRDLRRRRDRHQRPRGHRRARPAAAGRSTRPRRSTSSSPTATRSPAEIVGFDPFADVALLKVDPDGLDLHPLDARRRATTSGRRAGGGDRQPVRRGAVALGRRRLGHRPLDRVADRLPDRRRDPDRRLDQPRQLRRPAARRRRRGDRDQPADRDHARAATRASASRSRSTSSSARSTQLRDDGKVEYAYIGVTTQPLYPQLADGSASTPTRARWSPKVVPGGPADEAGLKGGDQKIRFQGQPGRRRRRRDHRGRRRARSITRDRPAAADLAPRPGRHGHARRHPRRRARRTSSVTLGERPPSVRAASGRGPRERWSLELALGAARAGRCRELGAHAGRAHAGRGRGRRRHLRDRRARRGVHGAVPAERAPDVAFYSEDRGLVAPAGERPSGC